MPQTQITDILTLTMTLYLENFPLKQMIFNWNSLSLELKATADPTDFETMLKNYYLSTYKSEPDCSYDCFICNA